MKDPRIEQVLNSNNRIAWEYRPVLALSEIDFDRSQHNQARILEGPIDKELVRQYVQALKQGDQFPAIVVYEDNGKYIVIDGNHRSEAYRQGKRGSIDAYVVLTENAMERQSLTFQMNTLNGRPSTEEDRDAHAVHLVLAGEWRPSEVAELLGMTPQRVRIATDDSLASDRASRLGAESAYKKIKNKDLRVRIARSLPLDSVFVLAVHFQAKYPLNRSDLIEFLAQTTAYGNEKDQVNYVKQRAAAAEHLAHEAKVKDNKNIKTGETKKRQGPMGDPTVRLRAHLRYFVNNRDSGAIRSMVTEERTEVRTYIEQVRISMDELERELDKADKSKRSK